MRRDALQRQIPSDSREHDRNCWTEQQVAPCGAPEPQFTATTGSRSDERAAGASAVVFLQSLRERASVLDRHHTPARPWMLAPQARAALLATAGILQWSAVETTLWGNIECEQASPSSYQHSGILSLCNCNAPPSSTHAAPGISSPTHSRPLAVPGCRWKCKSNYRTP